jgi:hypothetical protein
MQCRLIPRTATVILALLISIPAFTLSPALAHGANCRFVLGFQTLHGLIPDIVGNCLGNERHSPLTGDAFQDTTGPTGKGGLLVWRKASNVTSFTDGFRTWLIGPDGFQTRLNTQRFPWETQSTQPPTSVSPCRVGDPLANVHDPVRLEVLRRCQFVRGVVSAVEIADDGDVFINLRLAPLEAGLLTEANVEQQGGTLVLEIVPADQPGCTVGLPPRAPIGTANFGICTGANIVTPQVGTEISATGPYVLDTEHGWTGIHPVWAISR